jgi:hypothetical protein
MIPYLLIRLGDVAAAAVEVATTGASYLGEHYDRLGKAHRKAKERRRKVEERLWETARETYRQLHGIAREAPAVKPRAAKRAQAPLPAPSTINWNVLAVQIASIERLIVILEQIENARLEDEEDDEDFLFMAA